MLKFDEQKQLDSVNGALALRGQIESIVDDICKKGYRNICWLGIGGTYASCLQAEIHMKERSGINFYVENAAEIKKVVDIPVIAVGRINDVEIAESVLQADKADLVTMARASLIKETN